jgi:phage gpG-like protein
VGRVMGDFPKLEKILKDLQKAAGGDFMARAIHRVGKVAEKLAVEGARAGVNPMGRKWKPRKADGGQALARIAPSLQNLTDGLRVTIESGEPWANYHNKGAKGGKPKSLSTVLTNVVKSALGRFRGVASAGWKLPVRRILPKRAIPPKWYGPMVDEANKVFEETFEQG